MKQTKLLTAMLMVSSLALTGCSGGDDVDVVIEGDSVNGGDSGGGDGGNDSSTGDDNTDTAALQAAGFTRVNNTTWEFPAQLMQDVTLGNDLVYILDPDNTDTVLVGNGNTEIDANGDLTSGDTLADVTLTINAGVNIKASENKALVVTRGSKIEALGTAAEPIIFSSEDSDLDGRGEWGGLVLQGFGTNNICTGSTVCNIEGEGATGAFGGFDNNDNSGTLTYVVVAEGGSVVAQDNELNGVGFMGVGRNTTVDYLQVHGNDDDGVEFWGGAVNVKHLVLTNNVDDSIDWDEGYQGNIQFAIVSHADDSADHGIESDNAGAGNDATPRSKPVLANITFLGQSGVSDTAVKHRRGSGGLVHNSIITGFDRCIDIDSVESNNVIGTDLMYTNVIIDCAQNTAGDNADDEAAGEFAQNLIDSVTSSFIDTNPQLDNNLAATAPEASLVNPVDFSTIGEVAADSDAATFFTQTDYIGAVEDSADRWYDGWIVAGSLPITTSGEVTSDAELQAAGFTRNGTAVGMDGDTKDLWEFPAQVTSDITLSSDKIYMLDPDNTDTVLVGNGNTEIDASGNLVATGSAPLSVTLTIAAGTEVLASSGKALVVTRGSSIEAIGTAASPIIFHSEDANFDGRGEWGGLVLQGFGTNNICTGSVTCNIEGEGATGTFGGFDNDGDSGVLKYVVVAEGGSVVSQDNELNGVGFMGVGRNTTVDYLQVHGNDDDGVEFWGGAVNVKHLVLTDNVDDSVDWDEGYQGNIQFGIVKHAADSADHGIESDNAGASNDALPRSKPVLANMTFIGTPGISDSGVKHRRGTGVFVHNSILTGFDSCLDVDSAESNAIIGSELIFNNVIINCTADTAGDNADEEAAGEFADNLLADGNSNFISVDPALDANLAATAAEASLAGSTDYTLGDVASEDAVNSFFIQTDYIGAVRDSGDRWWDGWTVEGSLQ